jgi:hypothetical protein
LIRCGLLRRFGHRVLHLTAHMNLFVPVGTDGGGAAAAAAAGRRGERAGADWQGRAAADPSSLLAVNAVLFSVLGGALLTRYLLPMYPLVLLGAVQRFTGGFRTGRGWRCSRRRRLWRDCL